MKNVYRLFLVAVIAIMLGQLSVAQMGMGMRPPDIAGVFNPTVGAGAGYEIVKKDGGDKTSFDITVVDKDASGGYWIEYGMQSPKTNGTVYVKSLLTRQTDDVVIQRMIVQAPGRPPMDMSMALSMKGMQQSAKSRADFRADAEDLGTESVTTPAGTFECQHWRSKKDGSEVWISDKVSPWKLVKMNGPNNSMTLVRVISDAKSHITGTPMSIQDMMKQKMGNQ